MRRLAAAGVQGARATRTATRSGSGSATATWRCSTRRPPARLRGESTPFYLYNRDARRRIAADNPDARLIAVLRDPVDRAYSNWMHLRMDGLEPEADLVEAARREQQRVDDGVGAVLALPRPRHVRPSGGRPPGALPAGAGPAAALPRGRSTGRGRPSPGSARSSGVEKAGSFGAVGQLTAVRAAGRRARDRHGDQGRSAAGQYFPPHVWRRVSQPLMAQLTRAATRAARAHARAARRLWRRTCRTSSCSSSDRRVVRRVEGLPRRRVVLEPGEPRARSRSGSRAWKDQVVGAVGAGHLGVPAEVPSGGVDLGDVAQRAVGVR